MKKIGFILLFLLSMTIPVYGAEDVQSRLNKIDLENTGGNGTIYSNTEMELILNFLSKNYDKLEGRTTDEKFQDAMRRYDTFKNRHIYVIVSLLICGVISLPIVLRHFYKRGGIVRTLLCKINWVEYDDVICSLGVLLYFIMPLVLVLLLIELIQMRLWIGL